MEYLWSNLFLLVFLNNETRMRSKFSWKCKFLPVNEHRQENDGS